MQRFLGFALTLVFILGFAYTAWAPSGIPTPKWRSKNGWAYLIKSGLGVAINGTNDNAPAWIDSTGNASFKNISAVTISPAPAAGPHLFFSSSHSDLNSVGGLVSGVYYSILYSTDSQWYLDTTTTSGAGDNLGDHTATQALDMGAYGITDTGPITGATTGSFSSTATLAGAVVMSAVCGTNSYAIVQGASGLGCVELTGGAETNTLETTITGIESGEIFYGTGTNAGAFTAHNFARVADSVQDAQIVAAIMRDSEWTVATLTAAGKVELATVTETHTGTDATRAATPDGVHDKITAGTDNWLTTGTITGSGFVSTADTHAFNANNSTAPTGTFLSVGDIYTLNGEPYVAVDGTTKSVIYRAGGTDVADADIVAAIARDSELFGGNFSDLAGSITDAQVPDNITIAAAGITGTIDSNQAVDASFVFESELTSHSADTNVHHAPVAALAFGAITGSATDSQIPDDITVTAATISGTITSAQIASDMARDSELFGGNFSDLAGSISNAQVPTDITIDLATAASALNANPTNCAAGSYARGIAADGTAEDCTAAGSGTTYWSRVSSSVIPTNSGDSIGNSTTGLTFYAEEIISTADTHALNVNNSTAPTGTFLSVGDIYTLDGEPFAAVDGTIKNAIAYSGMPSFTFSDLTVTDQVVMSGEAGTAGWYVQLDGSGNVSLGNPAGGAESSIAGTNMNLSGNTLSVVDNPTFTGDVVLESTIPRLDFEDTSTDTSDWSVRANGGSLYFYSVGATSDTLTTVMTLGSASGGYVQIYKQALFGVQSTEASTTVGIVAYADSTNWNPGFGKGLYAYDGAAWVWLEAQGGAETNTLETAITGIESGEIFYGTGSNAGAFTAHNFARIADSISDAQVPTDITIDTRTVAQGGTGAVSLTDGGILLGSGTGVITALAVATNGQIPIGDGATDPVLATITPGAGIDVTNGAGTITIDGETATLTNPGIAEFATTAEHITGTDATRAATPDGITAALEASTKDWATTGTINGLVNVTSTTAATLALTAATCASDLHVNGDNDVITYTLPTAVAGQNCGFLTPFDAAVTVDPANTGDSIILGGTTLSAGDAASSSASAGAYAYFLAIDASQWVVIGSIKTWAGP